MNNLQKIQEAFKCGYGAVLDSGKYFYQVLHIGTRGQIMIRRTDQSIGVIITSCEDLEDLKITKYIYLGELGGNEIKEGQKFKIKGQNEIRIMVDDSESAVCLKEIEGNKSSWFPKVSIEPYFD